MPVVTVALLIKENALNQEAIRQHYLQRLQTLGIPQDTVAVFPLLYNTPIKVMAKTGKAYLDKLIDVIPTTVTKLIVCDSSYFKFITKNQKVSSTYGTAVSGKYLGYDRFECVYIPNYRTLFKQPENAHLIDIGLKVIAGQGPVPFIDSAQYAFQYGSDRELLDQLYQYPELTVDIEGTGLAIDSDVVSISFAWDEHNGIAIDISICGSYYTKRFLETYTGKLIFHHGLYDAKILVRNWWMEHPTDYAGMIEGARCFRGIDDTMLLTYLAKNATTPVSLGLKEVALEYVGNYAIELDDITKHTKAEILEYNLIDALGTFWVYKKYHAQITSEPYTVIFQPSIYPLLKMMLTGLPLDPERVEEVNTLLAAKEKVLLAQIHANSYVIEFTKQLQIDTCLAANAKLKTVVKTVEDFQDVEFNPNSHPQLAKLLFDMLGLPILDVTKTGAPSTKGDTLLDLRNHTTDGDVLDLLKFVEALSDVTKTKNTFIKPMRGKSFLHGSLKLGGTQSGRLSSSDPNLTNLPAHGPMGKLVKSCVVAPAGWVFAGADFSALEECIGTILSKDPNRVKVYTDGFDGHSMRTHRYFGEEMPDINPNDVVSINSIQQLYPLLRQKSKAPTFALQYGGTWHTLWKRSGFPQKQAKQIEAAYREMYAVSEEFNAGNQVLMEQQGYIECAFGLILHTPTIGKVILGNSKTPYEAAAEVRSANNAVTQSWGMLLNRAMNATNDRIEEGGYGLDILPNNMIHDAGYFMVRQDPVVIKFLNDVLIEEMEWNDHDLIRSIDVPMRASLDIGPSWNELHKLTNHADIKEISDVLSAFTGPN